MDDPSECCSWVFVGGIRTWLTKGLYYKGPGRRPGFCLDGSRWEPRHWPRWNRWKQEQREEQRRREERRDQQEGRQRRREERQGHRDERRRLPEPPLSGKIFFIKKRDFKQKRNIHLQDRCQSSKSIGKSISKSLCQNFHFQERKYCLKSF